MPGKDDRTRSEAINELFSISKADLPMKCETPPGLLEAFAMMETVEYALSINVDPDDNDESIRKKLLRRRDISEVYREKRDRRSISKSRKGRKELETVLASQVKDEIRELAI